MTPLRSPLLSVALTLSLVGNAVLGGLYYLRAADARFQSHEAAYRAEERDFLMQIIPTLRPRVAKADLAAAIHSRYPKEQVNVEDTELQWRLFHFWFDGAGRLVEVQWAS